jgi:hypothetical protein
MKKPLILFIFLFLFAFTVFSQMQWQPSPTVRVPEIADCTIGDIAVARISPQPHIRFCPDNAAAINAMFPGAGHFYYVHEYGHIVRGPSEASADNFAAQELARLPQGYVYINAMLSHLYYRSQKGEPSVPGYGTPAQRAARIASGALNGNSALKQDSQTLLLYE